ncbi:MAG: class I SAM-dependent methyltransferase [Betaproteobacteria bacterium]|nr:class I SAM-dependent methyltransferase [Betaproteobacteria bacterium]
MTTAGFDDARDFWDQRYRAPEYIFGEEPNAFVRRQIERIPTGAKVLDVACGEGRNSVWLARHGCEVVGVDISPLALAKARVLAARFNVNPVLVEADIMSWPWQPAQYDVVLTIFIQFAAAEGRTALFSGISRTLKPGGLLLLQGFNPAQLELRSGGPKDASHLYSAELLQELAGGLEIIHLLEHEGDLREGTKHVGPAALIDLIARKPM